MIYNEPPEDFNPIFEVVTGFIQHNGELLMVKRQKGKIQGEKWGFPGGKVDDGETLEQAFIREIGEETGIELRKKEVKHFKSTCVRYPDKDFHYHMFSVDLDYKPEVTLQEAELLAFEWLNPNHALSLGEELVLYNDVYLKMFYGL